MSGWWVWLAIGIGFLVWLAVVTATVLLLMGAKKLNAIQDEQGEESRWTS